MPASRLAIACECQRAEHARANLDRAGQRRLEHQQHDEQPRGELAFTLVDIETEVPQAVYRPVGRHSRRATRALPARLISNGWSADCYAIAVSTPC